MEKKAKKLYSYCSIGPKDEIFGTIEGIVLPIKIETYIKKDNTPGERMVFALSCRNVSEKIKSALGVTPITSKKNPETCFVNCTVFGKNVDRIRQFVHEQDVVLVSGAFTTYPSSSGDEHRINLRVNDVKVLKYHNRVENTKIENELKNYSENQDNSYSEEYPEF